MNRGTDKLHEKKKKVGFVVVSFKVIRRDNFKLQSLNSQSVTEEY